VCGRQQLEPQCGAWGAGAPVAQVQRRGSGLSGKGEVFQRSSLHGSAC